MSTHQYTIASFGGEEIVAAHISNLIAADAIGFPPTWVINVDVPSCVDKVEAVFSTSLNGAEITALGVLMAGYTAPVPIEDALTGHRYINGLELSWNSVSKLKIATGECTDVAGDQVIFCESILTLDSTVSGAGGLDTGTIASTQSYTVFVIGDASGMNTPSCLMSLSETAPTMPSGYDIKRRMGSCSTDSGSDFMDFYQWGEEHQRRYQWEETRSTHLRCLDTGVDSDWADVGLGHTVSDSVKTVIILVQTSTSLGYIRREGSDIATGENLIPGEGFETIEVGVVDNKIEYKITGGYMHIDIIGYTEEV